MNATRIEEIKARCEAATVGPWEICSCGKCGIICSVPGDCVVVDTRAHLESARAEGFPAALATPANGDFIAHARTDIPDILADNATLRAEVERLTELAARCDAFARETERLADAMQLLGDGRNWVEQALEWVAKMEEQLAAEQEARASFRVAGADLYQAIRHYFPLAHEPKSVSLAMEKWEKAVKA